MLRGEAVREALSVDPPEAAALLLGALFSYDSPEGRVTVRLSEVEAYCGPHDPGSHAYRGPTPRTRVMFGPAAMLYAYFSYGMHVCLNIICGPDGTAGGVLLRGGTVIDGIELARARRQSARADRDLARGPARLSAALGVPLSATGSDLLQPPFSLELLDAPLPYLTGPRTGVSGPGGSVIFPWRFWIDGDPGVSPYRRHPRSHD